MTKALLLLACFTGVCLANNTCTLNVGSVSHYTFSTTVASDWSSCGGVTPQAGDNISISGTAHSFTLDVAHTFGNGQYPVKAYLSSITGSAGGSTTCASPTSVGGTAGAGGLEAGLIACQVVAGACTPYIYNRGSYTATGTTNIASTCSGGSPTWTLNWNPGGGAPAILSGSGTQIIIAAAIVARGDVLGNDSYGDYSPAITFTNGGQLTFDFSLSNALTNTYNLGNYGNAGTWSRAYTSDSTCTTSTCGVSTTGGGVWRLDGAGVPHGPVVSLQRMNLVHAGDASQPWIWTTDTAPPYGGVSISYSHISYSSVIQLPQIGSGSLMNITNNSFTSSVAANLFAVYGIPDPGNLYFDTGSSWDSTGTRAITKNASDIALFQGGSVVGLTFNGNYSQGDMTVTDQATPWASATNNILIGTNSSAGVPFKVPGDYIDDLFYLFAPSSVNWHVHEDFYVQRNSTEQYNVYGIAVPWTGDSGEIGIIPNSSSYTNTFDNNIILPDGFGHSWSEPAGSAVNSAGYEKTDHNYWYADYGANNPAFGFWQLDEASASHTGVIASYRCNTLWNPSDANSFVKADDIQATPTVLDPGTAADIDYNWGRGRSLTQTLSCPGCVNSTDGYISHFSSSNLPGAHDNDAIDPGIDYTRTLETFATDYLHVTPTRGVWSSSADYATGDTVSSSVSGYYWSKALIYTCYAVAGCPHASDVQPGSSGNWTPLWEPYTMTWLKTSIPADLVFADSSLQVYSINEDAVCSPASPCDAVTAVRHWIFAGAVPSNKQFWGACAMDGLAIGPVDGLKNSRPTFPVAVN